MGRGATGTGVLATATGLALASSLLAPTSGSAEPPSSEEVLSPSGEAGESHQVTLVTGDVVHWDVDAEGKATATVEDKGVESSFQTIESDDDYYVIPSDVSPLVGHYLDRELFNVAGLVEQGYADDEVDGTPIILQGGSDEANRRKASPAPGLDVERTLPSIKSKAGTLGRKDAVAFGKVLSSAVKANPKKATATVDSTKRGAVAENDDFRVASLAGVEKIWLDQKVEASLENSVPQTGAPQAWAAGFDGTGTTIAVLDTGIDENHPDVAGKIIAAQDFSESGNVGDRHGHGTHVAATAAGSGNGSEGLRTGVAPGADLVIGKVLDDGGAASIKVEARDAAGNTVTQEVIRAYALRP